MEPILGKAPGPAVSGLAPAAGDLIKDSDTRHFVADVIEMSKHVPVIVDFWAPWCGPCKQLTPVLEKAVRQAQGKVRLVKINIDENQQLAQQLRVQSIPAVFAFVAGRPADGFMGALPESQIMQFVGRLTGSGQAAEIEAILAEAKAAMDAGDTETAAQIYAEVLQADREHAGAIAGLARCQIAAGDLDNAKMTLALVPPAKANDAEVLSAKAALELALNTVDLSEIGGLEAALARDAADHQSRLDLAMALNGAGRREEALEHLLTIVRKQRDWNDHAARKQLVTFFEAWGPKEELTLQGRRKLSSILFS